MNKPRQRQISVYLPETEKRRFDHYVRLTDSNKSKVLRRLIRDWSSQQRDAARLRGMAGDAALRREP